jgi:FMN phosphatase YigB (HAD superfamily)
MNFNYGNDILLPANSPNGGTVNILVDLDNTLIDVAKRLELEMGTAAKFGVNAEDYWKAVDIAFAKYGISGFRYQALFEGCRAVKPDFNDDAFLEWKKLLDMEYFFPDSIVFLKHFKPEELTLLTTGNPEFQWTKIITHGITKYFGKIFIVSSPKAENIERPPDKSFFIDDSPREIDAMKQRFPHVLCLQVRTPAPWEKQKHSGCKDAHFRDLLGAYVFIRENE